MPPALHAQASAASGISRADGERAKHLSPSIFARCGEPFFTSLATAFYSRAYAEPSLRVLFANTTRAAAERNQAEFLMQEFGDGRRLYAARKGVTAIIGRHAPYPVDEGAAVVWLKVMGEALREVEEEEMCDGEVKEALLDYFRWMACFIVCGRELVNPGRTVGYYGRHEEGRA